MATDDRIAHNKLEGGRIAIETPPDPAALAEDAAPFTGWRQAAKGRAA